MKWSISPAELKNPNGLDFEVLPPKEKQHFELLSLSKDIGNGKDLSEDLRKELDSKQFGVWAIHLLERKLKPREKRKYEIFCGGYLGFYDRDLLEYLKELSAKSAKTGVTVDVNKLKEYFNDKGLISEGQDNKLRLKHKIFFEWGKGGSEKNINGDSLEQDQHYVRIYINPPAGNPDPPRPPGPPPPESDQ